MTTCASAAPRPNVALNSRLYLYEYTSSSWNFVGSIKTYNPRDLNRTQLSTLTITEFAGTDRFPQAYKVDVPDLGAAVYFDIDDTQLHWEGVYSLGDENGPVVDGHDNSIDYTTATSRLSTPI